MSPTASCSSSIIFIGFEIDPKCGTLGADPSFSERLDAAVKDVNTKQNFADESIEGVIKGEVGIHEGMSAIGKASTSLKLLTAVRSKAMESYKAISNMSF